MVKFKHINIASYLYLLPYFFFALLFFYLSFVIKAEDLMFEIVVAVYLFSIPAMLIKLFFPVKKKDKKQLSSINSTIHYTKINKPFFSILLVLIYWTFFSIFMSIFYFAIIGQKNILDKSCKKIEYSENFSEDRVVIKCKNEKYSLETLYQNATESAMSLSFEAISFALIWHMVDIFLSGYYIKPSEIKNGTSSYFLIDSTSSLFGLPFAYIITVGSESIILFIFYFWAIKFFIVFMQAILTIILPKNLIVLKI